MRGLTRFQTLYSNSSYQVSLSTLSRLQIFHLSTRTSRPRKPQRNASSDSHTDKVPSLFNEITELLGADHLNLEQTPSGFQISEETHAKTGGISEEFPFLPHPVCRNDRKENLLQLRDAQKGNSGEIDVSPVVHAITQFVRAENCSVPMEERLWNSGFKFEPEVVEKVLKRCFKVPHIGLRFFNWVKVREGFCHTTELYNTVLAIAGEAKEFELMEKIEKEMEANSCEKDIKTWTILVSQYGKTRLIGKALLVFEKMRKCGSEPDAMAYKMMVRSLFSAGNDDILLEFYKEMRGKEMTLDLSLYRMVLDSVARLGDVDAIHSITDDMIRISQIPESEVYGCVLKSFCVSGRIKEALELIRNFKNKEMSIGPNYFETLVKGLCRAGRIGDAMEIVDIMKKRDLVDGKIYGIIINGYLRTNDLSNALNLFQRMKDFGYPPTASIYTELMQHLFKAHEYEKGCQLYDEILERGVQLDSVVITAMVAGHVRHNCIAKAWRTFNSMEDKGIKPTWKSYSVFIKELCKLSRTDEILKVLNKMQASKMVIGDKILQWVILCMEKKGEVENVRKVRQMQQESNLHSREDGESNTTVFVGHNLENHNPLKQDFKESHFIEPITKAYRDQDFQLVSRTLSSSTDWSVIQEALEKRSVQFTPELVLDILRDCRMHENVALHFFVWVAKQTGYTHSRETYNMAIKIAGRGKDFKHMRSLFYEMRRNHYLVTSDAWGIMIMQYGRAGLTEIALRVFGEMKADGYSPTRSTYKCLIMSLCGKKGRKVDEAIKIFNEMIHAGFIPDKESIEIYLSCLCDANKLKEARKCVESLCKNGFTIALSYSMYIRALCRAGKLEEALALVDEVGQEKSKLEEYIYGSLVHALLKRGQFEEALCKVEYMKQVGIKPTVHVYTSLIDHFFKEKQTAKALEIFEKMRQEGIEPTIVTYSALMRGFVHAGKVSAAWDVFYSLKMKGPCPDFKTYTMFIDCLCKVGGSEEALRLISDMLEAGIIPSSINFRTIFFGLNREGKQELARTVIQTKSAVNSRRKFIT